MSETWDWSLRVFDHVEVHAGDYAKSVRFYETVLAPLGIARGDDRLVEDAVGRFRAIGLDWRADETLSRA